MKTRIALKSKKELREKVNEFFNSLLPEKGNRLIIMVDELDRCKPSYAVKLLERIKHYFTNDRITFVFSVNTYELEKSFNFSNLLSRMQGISGQQEISCF